MRLDELAIVVRPERAHPAVEELDGLGAGGDLGVQVARRCVRASSAISACQAPGSPYMSRFVWT